jgi:hypothetical protein
LVPCRRPLPPHPSHFCGRRHMCPLVNSNTNFQKFHCVLKDTKDHRSLLASRSFVASVHPPAGARASRTTPADTHGVLEQPPQTKPPRHAAGSRRRHDRIAEEGLLVSAYRKASHSTPRPCSREGGVARVVPEMRCASEETDDSSLAHRVLLDGFARCRGTLREDDARNVLTCDKRSSSSRTSAHSPDRCMLRVYPFTGRG